MVGGDFGSGIENDAFDATVFDLYLLHSVSEVNLTAAILDLLDDGGADLVGPLGRDLGFAGDVEIDHHAVVDEA